MAHLDSSCSYDELKRKNAFIVDRHVLKIVQPISGTGSDHNDLLTIDCNGQGSKRWGRIDFPKGYSDWWLLSHIDFHVPSEHTQNGKRYAAELQLFHFYSVSGNDAGVDNEVRKRSFLCVLNLLQPLQNT
jgi:Eukaryotic-type carbonic anhydrase